MSVSYVCQDCSKTYNNYIAICPCGGLINEVETEDPAENLQASFPTRGGASKKSSKTTSHSSARSSAVRRLSEAGTSEARHEPTGIGELDRVLGGGFVPGSVTLLAGNPGAGKALHQDTPIPLASGEWTTMGRLRVGDIILDGSGNPTKVAGKFNPLLKSAFVFTFNNGEEIVSSGDHIWQCSVSIADEGMRDTQLTSSEAHELINNQSEVFMGTPGSQGFSRSRNSPEFIDMMSRMAFEEGEASLARLIDDVIVYPRDARYDVLVFAMKQQNMLRYIDGGYTMGRVEFDRAESALSFRRLLGSLGGIFFASPGSTSFDVLLDNLEDTGVEFSRNLVRVVSSQRLSDDYVCNHRKDFYCIKVDSPDSTFLCSDSYITTHNTTLCTSIAGNYAEQGKTTLYMSGEESVEQIALRASRMGIVSDNILVAHTSSLEEMQSNILEIRPDLVVVDSIQRVVSEEITSSVGSIKQSNEAAHKLTDYAKSLGLQAIFISQVNKSEDFAGSSAIQHIVDTTLFFESDKDSPLKVLRAKKNRFGSTEETGFFRHTEKGIEEVSDPSGVLMEESEGDLAPPGAAFSIISEGIRQIPVEIQGLSVASTLSNPQRRFSGLDHNRCQIICATLTKYCDSMLSEQDVFASTMFGMKVVDPLSDLAVAAAILSSYQGKEKTPRTIYVGELSLTGQVRGTYNIGRKVEEAKRMGFSRIVVPTSAKKSLTKEQCRGIEVRHISEVSEITRLI